MKYASIVEGTFIKRDNRFIAQVLIEGKCETVHVKNTGRCKELLIEGSKVFLEPSSNEQRKTRYSLVAIMKGQELINMDSQVPNQVVAEAMGENPYLQEKFEQLTLVKREVKYGDSRFDLYYETASKKGFIEVKGVTLFEEGVARFPDAPTSRGAKHLKELQKSLLDGYESYVFFLIQGSGIHRFEPNEKTDPDFAKALQEANEAGVGILCFDSCVSKDGIELNQPVEVNIKTR